MVRYGTWRPPSSNNTGGGGSSGGSSDDKSAIIIKKKTGIGVPKEGEEVVVYKGGKVIGGGVRTGRSAGGGATVSQLVEKTPEQKEAEAIAQKIKDTEKRQYAKAEKSLGKVVRKEVRPSGEVVYYGLSGREYIFPSLVEEKFDPSYMTDIRGGSDREEIRERTLQGKPYMRSLGEQREELIYQVTKKQVKGKISRGEYIEPEQARIISERLAQDIIGDIAPKIGITVEKGARGYTYLRKGEEKLIVPPTLTETKIKGGKEFTAKYYPEFISPMFEQMKEEYRPQTILLNIGERIAGYEKGGFIIEKPISFTESLTPLTEPLVKRGKKTITSVSSLFQKVFPTGIIDAQRVWGKPLTESIYKKGKEVYPTVRKSFKTLAGVGLLPINIGIQSYRDFTATALYMGAKDYIAGSTLLTGFSYGTKKIEETFAKLPSSKPLQQKLITRTKRDIGYGITPSWLGETNIYATGILGGAYETIRTKPLELTGELLTAIPIGAGFGYLSKYKKVKKGLQVAGLGIGTLYLGSVGLQTYLLPKEERGAFLGEEALRSTAFIAGFGRGFKLAYKGTLAEQLAKKGGLEYLGEAIYQKEPITSRYGIITEQYPNIKRLGSSGIIQGKISKRAEVRGTFFENVKEGTIYETRQIRYKGTLFEKDFLVTEKIFKNQRKSITKVFEIGTEPKEIGIFKRKIMKEYYSPLTRGIEQVYTKQIKSLTPERGIELYREPIYKRGEVTGIEIPVDYKIKQRTIQTGKQQDLLRRLRILQQREALTYEISPTSISGTYTEMGIDLTARQTRPQKNILYGLKYRPKTDILKIEKIGRGFEPFYKYPVAEKAQFRDLYFGIEKFESRQAKFIRDLYPTEYKIGLEKEPQLIKSLTAGESILKEFKLKAKPIGYVGIEERFVPALISKQQKVTIRQKFEFRIPRDFERLYIQKVLRKELTKKEKEQKLFGQFLEGKYTTMELFKEIKPERIPFRDKQGRILTPNYLKKINAIARKKNIKANQKYFNIIDKTMRLAEKNVKKAYPKLVKEINTGKGSKMKIYQYERLLDKAYTDIRAGKKQKLVSVTKPKKVQKGKALEIEITRPVIRQEQRGVIKAITETRVTPKIKSKALIKSRVLTRNRVRNEIRSSLNLRSNLYTKAILRSNVKTNIRTELNAFLKQDLKQNLKTELRQELKTPIGIDTRVIPPIIPPIPPVPPPIPPPIKIPEVLLDIRKKKKGKKVGRPRFRYQPSLVAVGEQITGARPKVLSGLGIRPL